MMILPEYVAEYNNYKLTVHDPYIKYYIDERKIDILAESFENKYTIDLEHFWFSEYDNDKLTFELRKCIDKYEKSKTEFYVKKNVYGEQQIKYKDRNLKIPEGIITVDTDFEIKDTAVRYDIAIRNINISFYTFNDTDLITDWGDNISDTEVEHLYKNGEYKLITTGTVDIENYIHTGKNIKAIECVRSDIIDASWLFAECFYAEDESFFPILNSGNIENMNHMFYHCPRLKVLDISHYNTLAVKDTSHMFDSCINLRWLNISEWNLPLTIKTDCMFMNCINLKDIRLDNSSYSTIKKIIESKFFPTNILGTTEEDVYNDTKFDSETKDFYIPDYMIQECSNARVVVENKYFDYDPIFKAVLIAYILSNVRKIYCKKENTIGLVAPKNWTFEYNLTGTRDVVRYDSIRENLYIPNYMIEQMNEVTYLYEEHVDHNEEDMNMSIS